MEDTIQEVNYQTVHYNNIDSPHYLISILYTCFELYFTHSARSSKKVDYIHNYFIKVIENIVIKNSKSGNIVLYCFFLLNKSSVIPIL